MEPVMVQFKEQKGTSHQLRDNVQRKSECRYRLLNWPVAGQTGMKSLPVSHTLPSFLRLRIMQGDPSRGCHSDEAGNIQEETEEAQAGYVICAPSPISKRCSRRQKAAKVFKTPSILIGGRSQSKAQLFSQLLNCLIAMKSSKSILFFLLPSVQTTPHPQKQQ